MNTKLPRLILSLPPYADESLLGYLLRLGELNHYKNISWMLELSGQRLDGHHIAPEILFKEIDLQRLSILIKCDSRLLEDKTHPSRGMGHNDFYGHIVPKTAIHSLYPKICPLCISESGYHKTVWDFALTTCCHIHACLLINKCPFCDRRINWFRGKMAECICGRKFADSKINEVPVSETALAGHIYTAIRYTQDPPHQNVLFSLALGDLFDIVKAFCRNYEVFEHTTKHPLWKIRDFPIGMAHSRIIKAVTIFDNWPGNFYQFLEKTNFRSGSKSHHYGLRQKFGNFTEVISRLSTRFELIKETFNSYIVNAFNGPVYRFKPMNEGLKSSRYMTKIEAASFLEVSENKIDRLLANSEIEGRKILIRHRNYIMIERASVENFKFSKPITVSVGKDYLSKKELHKRLGIGTAEAMSLQKTGLLVPDCKYPNHYCIMEVNTFLDRLNGFVKDCPVPCRLMPLMKARYQLRFLGMTLGDVLSAVFNTELIPRSRMSQNLINTLQFSQEEVLNYKKIRLNQKVPPGSITIQSYSQKVRVAPDSIRFVIGKGFLKSRPSGVWHVGEILNENDIATFENNYIFLSQLAKKHRAIRHKLLSYLLNLGIQPVSGSQHDGGISCLFSCKDLQNLDNLPH
jgi:hypothetical protein